MLENSVKICYYTRMLEVRITIEYYEEKTELGFCFDRGITLILGEVGSFKTTLLRTIGGVKEIIDGEIILDEKHIEELPPKDRNMSLVSADTIPTSGKVRKILTKPLVMRGINKKEASISAEKVARSFSLDLNKNIKDLDKNELLSLVHARLMLRQTEVSMFDEPYHLFDDESAVTDMIKSRRGYVLVTSCDGSDLKKLNPDYVAIVKRDKVVQYGEADTVLSSPTDKYTELLLNI